MKIPADIKRMARGRKIVVWTKPFAIGMNSADDQETSENPDTFAFSQRLTERQLDIIKQAVGSYSMLRIKAFLMRVHNIHDMNDLTWTEIFKYLLKKNH